MFGKGKVRKHGAQAQAVILDSDMSGYSNSHGARKWHLKLRVQFDDGTTGEASCSAYPVNIVTGFNAGQIVPVRYDPDNRSKVEFDEDAARAESEAGKAAGRAGLIKLAEEKLAKGEAEQDGLP